MIADGSGGEVFAEADPGVAAIGGFKQVVAAVVERLGIVRRNDERRIPLEAVARRGVAVFQRADGFRFAGLQVAARKIAILGFRVDDVRVGGVDARVEAVAALHGDPILVADAGGLKAGAGTAPRIVVLQAAADVIRLLEVVRDLVELSDGDIVQVAPIAAAVPGDPDAAIVAAEHVVGIRGVDPDGVNVAVDIAETGLHEGSAAILRHVDVDTAEPDLLIVIGVHADLAEVGGTGISVAHAGPGGALVFGAVNAAERGMLEFRVHDVGVFAIDVDGATAHVAGCGQAAGHFGPVRAAVDGAVETGIGTAAVVSIGGAAALIGGGVEDVGARGIDGDIGDAGVFVDGQRQAPGGAAVGAFVDAALFVRSPQIAERRDVHDVGIGGVDHDAADVVSLLEAQVRPGNAGIHRFVDAIAPRRALAIVGLAGADVENRRVGWREGEVADRGVRLIIEDGLPGVAAVDRLEDSSCGGADVHDAGIGFHYGEVVDASTHGGGADVAELQVLQNGIVRGLRDGAAGQ